MGVTMRFHVPKHFPFPFKWNQQPSFAKSEDKIEILDLKNGILILPKTHHVALGKSINSFVSCVYKTGIVTVAHRCCQHYLINEQRVENIKYCTNVNHYGECSVFCRYKSAVYMLIIIIIITNTNNIATNNAFTLQWDLSMSFGLTSCPALSGSLAKQLFNDHCSAPPQTVPFIRSINSRVCKPT